MPTESKGYTTERQGLDAESVGSSSLFNSEEELFAFARCVSRLAQMGSVCSAD